MIAAIAPFALLLLCAVPWLLVIGPRFGNVLAAVSVLTGLPLLVLVSFHVSRLVHGDPITVTLWATAGVGVVGVMLTLRFGGSAPSRRAVATWLPAAAGLLTWLAVLAISPLVQGSIRGWPMRGDAANNLRISREMIDNHGHLLTHVQSVPLQNELLAMAMARGRGGDAGDVFAHDLYALAVMEALAIGLTGVMIGVVAGSLLPPARLARRVLVGIVASLACTTWFVTGLPLESGYLNVHVVLPFILASWVAFLESYRHPRMASVALLGLGLVVSASWVPLVVVPFGFGFAILLRLRHSARMTTGTLPTAAAALLAVAAGAIIIPNSAAVLNALSGLRAPGHGFPTTAIQLGATIAIAIAIAVLAVQRKPQPWPGVVSASAASLVGLAILMALNVSADPPWLAYYPAKYTWLVTVLMLTILAALLVRLIDERIAGRRATLVTVAILAAGLLASTLGPQPLRQNFVIRQPFAIILGDQVFTEGERSVEAIIRYNSHPGLELQWATGSPDEAFINFWALDFKGAAPGLEDSGPRYFTMSSYQKLRDTGSYTPPNPPMLCSVVGSLGGQAIVHTRDPRLDEVLEELCPEVSFDVRLDLD